MKTIFYKSLYCKGNLVLLSKIDSISKIKNNIVYIDSRKMFDLKKWVQYKPKCIFVEHSTLFSHIVSYCIGIDVAVVLVQKSELTDLEDKTIIINFVTETICSPDTSFNILQTSNDLDINSNINTVKTLDGKVIKLYATIKNIENAIQAKKIGVKDAGLVCTEYLFSASNYYSFEESLNKICCQFYNGITYIRLFDYDVDKLFIDFISPTEIGRGIRAFHNDKVASLISRQIKHLVRISKKQQVCVVIPYVTNVEDIHFVDNIIRENNNGTSLPICAMIETPASFFSVSQLSKYVSSFSIGTNDLLSSFFSCDRDSISDNINYFSPYNWGLLKMLSEFPSNCLSKVKVCGQLPLYPIMLDVLISLGYRNFSIPTPMIPIIAQRIKKVTTIPKSLLIKNTSNCYNSEIMMQQLLKMFNHGDF